MELLQLKYFLEVAQSQHVTRSAEKLHIAQPSLTQAIKRLEAELGVRLIAPNGRNIILTDSGKFLKRKLEPLMESLDALPEQIRDVASPEHTTIRLHVTAASKIVSEAIINYKHEHENTMFQFLQNEDSSLFDLSIEGVPVFAEDKGGNGDVFHCDEEIFLAVPSRDKGGRSDQALLSDFSEADFISLLASKSFRRITDGFCAGAGFHPRIAFESDNPDTVRNMIAANMGVGFWPAFSWGEIAQDNVTLLGIISPYCHRSIVIKLYRNRMNNSIIEDFFNFLSAYFLERMQSANDKATQK